MSESRRCKATSVALTKLEVQLGQHGLTLSVESLLIDSAGMGHGRSKHVGPWGQETVERLNELVAAVEDELTNLHFEVDDGDATATNEFPEKPKGLLGARLGGSEDPTPQL